MSRASVDVREALRAAADRLADAGIDSARVDAELLLGHVLGIERSRLAVVEHLDPAAAAAFATLVQRRASREPLQHLIGRAPFRHLALAVGAGVFVPRPETELLVDAVLPQLRGRPAAVAVDLCAGSGALALAVAQEAPGTRVLAVERPGPAVAWLRRNVESLRRVDPAAGPVEVRVADVTEPELLAELRGAVDAVVANPPYVPAATPVAPEVRADPPEAVFAGPDGLSVLPEVINRAAELLRPGGVLAVEHDDTQAAAVAGLLADGRWRAVSGHRDLSGRPRYATAIRADAIRIDGGPVGPAS